MKHFYSHLITLEHIKVELSGLDLTKEQQTELLLIAQKQIHHVMLDQALSNIKGEDKKVFLQHIANQDNDHAWEILRKHMRDAEKHFLNAAHEVYEQLREDMHNLK